MARGEFVQAGRLFEASHRLDDAVDAYVRGGAYNDAARLLSHQGLFRESGETLLFYLPRDPTAVERLSPDERRHALNAALCFARGGARHEAVGLLMNLGEHQKAASLLSMAGLRHEAVQAMRGQPVDGSPWPAGVVFPLRPAPPKGRGLQRRSAPGDSGRSRTTSSARLELPTRPPPQPPDASARPTGPTSSSGLSSPFAPAPGRESGARRVSTPGSRPPETARQLSQPAFVAPSGAAEGRSSGGNRPVLGAGRDPGGSVAVMAVLRARWHQDPLSARMLQMIDGFLDEVAAHGAAEADRPVCYAIGRLYEVHDRMGQARKGYQLAGGLGDAAERLANLDQGLVHTADGRWLPLHLVVDGQGRGFAPLPELDRLPGLGRSSADDTMDFDDFMASPGTSNSLSPVLGPAGASSAELWAVGPSSDRSLERSISSEDPHGPIGEGSVVADRYRIESLVGQGGMGTVYSATDMELEEVVALKVFQQVVQNKPGLERFRREMKLSRKLIHPNVVRIYEFGTWRGARYITMELLSGMDLEAYTESEGGTLNTALALSLMMQACDGLTAAHKQGVVHRDIKPQNLYVVDGGKRLKIMDFGIAKVSNGASISVTGVRVGTPRYMSPEQIQGGGAVGPAADLYALGGVMYELFTGAPVFEEEELVPLLLNHMTEEPVPPSVRNPEVPAEVEHIILRLLQKNPEDRYRDAAELKRELLSAYVQAERLHRS